MSRGPSGAIAAGHDETVAAAETILRTGGNAFDAIVGAGFAAAVAEPLLTSAAGGGFCLVHRPGEPDVMVDFFVDAPGRGLEPPRHPHEAMTLVTIDFTNTQQDFWCGWGSVAVPGNLVGWLHVHERFGRLDLGTVLEPAISLAERGVVVNAQQAYLFRLLTPILLLHDETARRLTDGGRPHVEGSIVEQPEQAAFLRAVGEDSHAAVAIFAAHAVAACEQGGGRLTAADLAAYRAIERVPLEFPFRGHTVVTNPEPSLGGGLIAAQLGAINSGPPLESWDDPATWEAIFRAQLVADRQRGPMATNGTTHATVADGEGNVASMTTSNGSGSGCTVPGTGVMLNNILGEDDLFPEGLGTGRPGQRVSSMMSPTMLRNADRDVVLALGSGGSKRIRTAISQVLARYVDHEPALGQVVGGPRMHFDGETIQIEDPVPDAVVDALREIAPVNRWSARDLYFGGVHAVVPGTDAAGDDRRGGAAVVFASDQTTRSD